MSHHAIMSTNTNEQQRRRALSRQHQQTVSAIVPTGNITASNIEGITQRNVPQSPASPTITNNVINNNNPYLNNTVASHQINNYRTQYGISGGKFSRI